MSFSSINIQGNIVSSEILDKIRTEEKFKHQSSEAFGLSRTASLRNEIGMAWSIMRAHWQAYKVRLENLPKGDTGTSLTREKLIIPLLAELGYQVSIQKAQQINGKSYAISHGATNRDMYPIHVMGYNDHLDKRRENSGPRLSPHALVQEYLNNTEHLFALVTNGRQLRLLRDATRLVRMSYLEFDLERMFEEELYSDFSLLYRVLHVSRMPETMDSGADAVIEYYHLESLASGTRIREKLSEAVENSIKTLANGFLSHKNNTVLIDLFENSHLDANTFYIYQLRLIYRILFLIVLEERKLIFPDNLSEEEQRFQDIYYRYYSIERLRKLTGNRVYVDADKYDLWESLKTTFLLFEDETYGRKMGIKPLGSGLFASNALGNLKEQFLSNGNLIEVLKRLTTFVSDQGQLVRVNYSDLDVEEFGSVYEGLLEYDPKVEKIGAQYTFTFVLGDGRSSSGSHYTPEELVKPLIKHSLDYIIADKLKEEDPEAGLLSITVCDVACGSGHILLSAARKIATELASFRESAEQPSPTYYRAAIRDVIRNCIYGVDLNPLAVELCKVALWLEAHNPNEPLNFLDHHIKCGNAIVGLAHFKELQNGIATEAFKTLPGDKKEVAATLRKRNTEEQKRAGQLSTYDTSVIDDSLEGILNEFNDWANLTERTPDDIANKDAAYTKLTSGKKWFRIKQLADIQIAQFFIPKTLVNREKLITDNQYRTYLNTPTQIVDRGPAMAMAIAQQKRFFHWFLEFPKVFQNGGFDCVLGNPPYLGGSKISTFYGKHLTNYLSNNYANTKGTADLVTYFLRRIFNIQNDLSFLSIITTNSISQGKTRESGIQVITQTEGGKINFAIKNKKWPGKANVEVSLLTIHKGNWNLNLTLDNSTVDYISIYLDSEEDLGNPFQLKSNENLGYTGVKVYGEGFILNENEKNKIVCDRTQEAKVIKPFITGDNINSDSLKSYKRYAIDLNHCDNEKEAMKFKASFEHLKNNVYPYRMSLDGDLKIKEFWWKYERERKELFQLVKKKKLDSVFVMAQTSKHIALKRLSSKNIYSVKCIVFASNEAILYSNIQSSLHTIWVWKYGTTMGSSTIQYGTTSSFNTYPLSVNVDKSIGENLEDKVSELQDLLDSGTTEVFNKIHSPNINEDDVIQDKVNVTRGLIIKLDKSLVESYGWFDINLKHNFYEISFLPENDNIRYTMHPDASKEILKRLLLLNHERYEDEIKKGLHKKKDVIAFYKQKNKEIPESTVFSDVKIKAKKLSKKKITIIAGQEDLFATNTSNVMKEFSLHDGIYTIRDAAAIINKSTDRVRRWFTKLSEINYEGLDNSKQQDIEQRRISFHGLIELVVIGELIEEGFNIQKIFKSRTDLANKTIKTYPFATNDVNKRLKVSGSDITWEFENGNVTLNGKGQFNIEIVREFFRDIEFDTSGIAQRIIPSKGLGKIEITPKRAGGKPSIISQQGVRVETILRFYDGPESVDDIISDYGISEEDINAAIAFQS